MDEEKLRKQVELVFKEQKEFLARKDAYIKEHFPERYKFMMSFRKKVKECKEEHF